MKRNMIRMHILPILLLCLMLFQPILGAYADQDGQESTSANLTPDAKSAVLMEASTGTILYEKNAEEALPPASVTKIMTLLLTIEAIRDGKLRMEDPITVSETAAGMGGSQVFLEVGEQMTVRDLLKCVAVASANDAAVALAEAVAGSMAGFVARMNERAHELGMTATKFENPTGLDSGTVAHLTSAKDIAIMSRELLKHEEILEFTTIWMDSVRGGAFGLSNTNRLIRFYKGANGLKTGFTASAGFCISATAKRDGMQLIAVIMGAPTRDSRNKMAAALLDYGFAGFELFTEAPEQIFDLPVTGSNISTASGHCEGFSVLLQKGKAGKVEKKLELPEILRAPIRSGELIGKKIYVLDGVEIGESKILCEEQLEKIGYWEQFRRLLEKILPL